MILQIKCNQNGINTGLKVFNMHCLTDFSNTRENNVLYQQCVNNLLTIYQDVNHILKCKLLVRLLPYVLRCQGVNLGVKVSTWVSRCQLGCYSVNLGVRGSTYVQLNNTLFACSRFGTFTSMGRKSTLT